MRGKDKDIGLRGRLREGCAMRAKVCIPFVYETCEKSFGVEAQRFLGAKAKGIDK